MPCDARSAFDQPRFEAAVRKVKEYIAAGDTFQTVLSRRIDLAAPDPLLAYRYLRALNPAPYVYYLHFDDVSIVGSSPEILVRVEEGEVTLRPIAGTRPRGATPEADEALERELLADPKERAEHLMLVDLGRNDVGRVAAYGSVRLTAFMTVERPEIATLLRGIAFVAAVVLLVMLVPAYGIVGAAAGLVAVAALRLLFTISCFPLVLGVGLPRLWLSAEDLRLIFRTRGAPA